MPGLGDAFVNGLSPEDWQQLLATSGGMPVAPPAPAGEPGPISKTLSTIATPSQYPMSPDLMQAQLGNAADAPPGYARNDAGVLFNKQTGAEDMPETQRSPLSFISTDPSGKPGLAIPGIADVLSNIVGGRVPGTAGEVALGAGAARKVAPAAESAAKTAVETISAPNIIVPKRELITPLPGAAEAYPEAGAFILKPKTSKSALPGETYPEKIWTPQEAAIAERRDVANRNIKSGNYEPYYNIAERRMVDPSNYPGYVPTITQRGADTTGGIAALRRRMEDIKGAEPKLITAYRRGEDQPGAFGFYQMKQWEDEYIKHFGPEEGRRRFMQNFVEPMAGTTSGNNPEMNYIVSQRAKWMGDRGVPFPLKGEGPDIPYPSSGAAMGVNNFREFQQQVQQGGGLQGGGIDWLGNPKKYNFGYNFLGSGGPTVDKQMMSIISKKGLEMPPTGGYGVYEQPIHNAAQKLGIDPITMQEVAWAGKKLQKTPNYTPVPMMHHINTAIERTATVTGLPHDEVVRRMIKGEIPVYSVGGAGGLQDYPGQ